MNSRHKTFCCVLFTVADGKGWKLVQLSIWESEHFKRTCSWHEKTSLECCQPHRDVSCCICKKIFLKIFSNIYAKLRTGSQNPSDVHFLDCHLPVAFILSPTFTRQLCSGNGRVRFTGGHCWKQETSSGGGKEEVESQVVFRFQCFKICGRPRVIWRQEIGHDRIWFGQDEVVFSAWYWSH